MSIPKPNAQPAGKAGQDKEDANKTKLTVPTKEGDPKSGGDKGGNPAKNAKPRGGGHRGRGRGRVTGRNRGGPVNRLFARYEPTYAEMVEKPAYQADSSRGRGRGLGRGRGRGRGRGNFKKNTPANNERPPAASASQPIATANQFEVLQS